MPKKRRMPRYASVMADEEHFWRRDPKWRAHLISQARKRPTEWRFALMFDRKHKPETWSVGPNGLGRDVEFRVSTERNVAGYFVGWRSVEEKEGPRSVYDYVADKDRHACRAKALRRALRYAERRGNNAAVTRLMMLERGG